ncbi:MAG: hypothetical protein ACR2PS_01135 [Pseudomonadales bacterium]
MKYAIPFLCLILVSCTTLPQPQTMRQNLAAAELSFQGALRTIQNLQQSGTIQKGSQTARNAATAVRSVNQGLVSWRANVDSPAAQQGVLSALTALSTLLNEIQR